MKSKRLPAFTRGHNFVLEVDGQEIDAYAGETIATILLAAGMNTFHFSTQTTNPDSRLFCGMGVCRQCLVTINGRRSYLACQTMAKQGMKVKTGQ
jgi:predicted molibdopterin-dependent oxidoreductase YjgC